MSSIELLTNKEYKYGFVTDIESDVIPKGLSEVIKVLDDDQLEGHCRSFPGVLDSCVHTSDCGIRPVLLNVHEAVAQALSNITLAQLVGSERNVDAALHQIQGLRPAPGTGAGQTQ